MHEVMLNLTDNQATCNIHANMRRAKVGVPDASAPHPGQLKYSLNSLQGGYIGAYIEFLL